jgi:putative PEP-CTERM system TPR-repeat lipoprotein
MIRPLRLTGVALALATVLSLGGCVHKDAGILRAQAEQMRQKGQFREAVITLKNALEAEPGSAATRYQLARTYLDTGEALSAEKEARQALRDGYDREATLAVLGRSLVLQGEYKKVLAEVESVGPKARAILPVRADALLALGQRDQARALFTALNTAEPRNTDALIGLGRIAYIEGDQGKAMGYAEQILAVDPNNTDALMFKADLLRASDKGPQALAVYDRVLALSPEHRTAHIEKAYLSVGLGRFDDAQAELNEAAKVSPNSMLVVYTQALLAYSRNNPAAANESLQRVLRVAPDHMPTVLLAGAVSLKLGAYFQAEQHFRHYLERNPDNLYARKMLAESLLGSGHPDAALAVLDAAIKEKGADAQLLALAGESNLRSQNFDAAVDLFEKATELDPASASMRTSLGLTKLAKGDRQGAVAQLQKATELDKNSVQAAIALVRTEQRLGHLDRAMAAVQGLEKAQPNNALVYELKGLVYVDMKDMAQARASFRRAVQVDPGYFAAAADLGQLDLQEGKPEQARKEFDDFLARNKDSTEAMAAQAALADHMHKPKEATAWLERAVAIAPHAIPPSVNLVAQYLRTGEKDKALTLAKTMRVEHPDDPDLLDLLAKSQLANGDQEGALGSYKQMQQALPRSAPVLMQVAAMHLMSGNLSQAEDELKGVLAMQPDFPSAQVELARLYVRKGSPDLALLMAGTLQRQYPKGAAGFELEGDVMMAKNQPPRALEAYGKALALNPNTEVTIKTDNALRRAGRTAEADQRLEAWLGAHRDDTRVLSYRAEIWMAAHDYKRAAGQLEALLKRQPGDVKALNNLALTYQGLGDLRALPTAEQALAAAGDNPDVMDTLGWMLADKSSGDKADLPRALTLLQKAHALAPKARDIRYHLAAVLYRCGAKDDARKELEALAAGDMRFAQADEVRALLAEVRRGG